MKKQNNTSVYLVVGFLSVCLSHSPAATGTALASDGHDKAGAPAPTFSLEAAIPDGVIGVSLHVGAERVGETAVLYVAQVLPDGPAEKAGLKQGDELTTVDGVAVTGKTYEQVALLVRGEPGSVVKLGVKSEGGPREVSVTRVSGQTLYKGQMGSHGGSGR
ncbi:MAG: PDZ domain-containing protein [Nitrospira sp.]|nr:PDZ domain-containing protein [Nitrospira sp.]MCS6262452.1 PDZ domain-containing protein [Nitrospira sp.]